MTKQDSDDRKKARPGGVRLNIPESVARGVYSNSLMVSHTREEFVLDFINAFPPHPMVTARVILGPGHLKRLIGTLSENLEKYETKHAVIPDFPPRPGPAAATPEHAAGAPGAAPAAAGPVVGAPAPAAGTAAPDASGESKEAPGGPAPARRQGVQVKYSELVSRGVYSNSVMVAHTREEFILDFINLFPPQATVTARVITSPGHFKRLIRALRDNLGKYEGNYGPILDIPSPPETPGGNQYVM